MLEHPRVRGWSPNGTLVEAFAAIARQWPERPAVDDGDRQLTYAELDAHSTGLAHRVTTASLHPLQPVGIMLDRSVDFAVAMLAILKAGRAYVPLDPRSPAARNAMILEDADPGAVVTVRELASSLPAHLPLVNVDETAEQQPDATPLHVGTQDERAYVIFTSGTTGRPKGVQVTHSNVLRLFSGTEPLFGYSCEDVWSVAHSFAFDFSVWELWGALLYGGCARVVPRDEVADPEMFLDVLADAGITVLSQTPSAFRQLQSQRPSGEKLDRLRLVVFGGEALRMGDLAQWFADFPFDRPRLVNMYGITETTVHASYHVIRPEDVHSADSIIGRPLPDLELHLLDETGEPVPAGQVGELVVVGPGVSRGYLRQPDLTAERFVALSNLGCEHVVGYRSGDLARLNEEGLLEYHGRADGQVKIRGHRVELGEIEAALRAHEQVGHAAVLVRHDDDGLEHVVAFVVPSDPERPPAPEDVLKTAAERLPSYMVPAALGCLPSLPTTMNGKLDLDALPALTPQGSGLDVEAGVTETERRLCRTFEGVLGAANVGLDDDFFDLGGHSLTATRLVNEIRRHVPTPRAALVSLSQLYRTPTVRALADWLDAQTAPDSAAGLPSAPDATHATGAPLVLRSIQAEMLLDHLLNPDAAVHHCLIGWQIEGAVDIGALKRALEAVHRRHLPLRSRYDYAEEATSMSVDTAGPPWAVLTGTEDGAALDELADHLCEPLELGEGLVWRAALISTPHDSLLLGVAVHHVAFDGWSESVFAREISDEYRRAVSGTDGGQSVPSLRLPVAAATASPQDEESLEFWRKTLTGTPRLEYDAGNLTTSTEPVMLEVPIPQNLYDRAASLAVGGRRFSAFTTFLSAYASALMQESGQFDLGIGSPIALRQGILERDVIGCFINVVCLRLRLEPGAHGPNRLRRIDETVKAAFAHCEVGMGDIVRAVNPIRDDRPPLFQNIFTLQSVPPAELVLPGALTERLYFPPRDLPTEFLAELWPARSGRPLLTISFLPHRVPTYFAQAVAKSFLTELEQVVALTEG